MSVKLIQRLHDGCRRRAEVNFELVERLAEREARDWTYFGRLRHERERSFEIRGTEGRCQNFGSTNLVSILLASIRFSSTQRFAQTL